MSAKKDLFKILTLTIYFNVIEIGEVVQIPNNYQKFFSPSYKLFSRTTS